MISYEDLCRSLDIYNRKLRGEDVPEEAYQEHALDDELDIVESEDMGIEAVPDGQYAEAGADGQYAEAGSDGQYAEAVPDGQYAEAVPDGQYAEAVPDVTAETAVPPADFGGGYDQSGSGEVAQGGYDSGAVPGQPAEGMASDQYSSGQQAQAGNEQAPEQQPGTYPDDQDPNRQQ